MQVYIRWSLQEVADTFIPPRNQMKYLLDDGLLLILCLKGEGKREEGNRRGGGRRKSGYARLGRRMDIARVTKMAFSHIVAVELGQPGFSLVIEHDYGPDHIFSSSPTPLLQVSN